MPIMPTIKEMMANIIPHTTKSSEPVRHLSPRQTNAGIYTYVPLLLYLQKYTCVVLYVLLLCALKYVTFGVEKGTEIFTI